ncbi:MAG: preprotein translocase subunit SecE [Methylococcales symbiont of Hymedesmia sp. n. MRB-2018]|nr:MAG: preprotein translocase subunit SecE [Methylococcales symbiont of Hymedesmia sp. n. MRB-2018]KAF3982796.1 MAG: preprotein translocase subunit SecE [Methylococcales symbiont of Hymedesmia sp. n. MRB-2018]
MNAQAEDASKILDVVKQGLSLVFVVAGIVAFYYFAEEPGFILLYRVLALVTVVIIALSIMATTVVGRSVWIFALEAKQEVRKVVWPSREETTKTTLLVFGMVFLVGLILWFLDMFLFWGIKILTGQGG